MPGTEDQKDHPPAAKPSNDTSSFGHHDQGAAAILAFQPSRRVKKILKEYRTELAAGSSSVVSTFITFPLDFAKSRMQSYHQGFISTVKDAWKLEGLRAFWRGSLPPMVSITFVRTMSFSIYQRAKYGFDAQITSITGKSPLVIANKPGSYPTVSTVLCFGAAGATAGAIITTLSCPFELTKLNEQLAGKMEREAALMTKSKSGTTMTPANPTEYRARGSLATARRLVRDRGFTGLYAGYRMHLLRDTIGTAIYFMTYESAKQLMGNARGNSPTSPYAVMVAGGLCGIASWACIYPIDVAKTLYQKALLSAGTGHPKRPPIEFFKFGSYRGLGVSVLRSAIINMIFFSNFELVKKRINALEVDDDDDEKK